MSYRSSRSLGYQPWGVTNPWVFADLSQPQRQRGSVSPLVFQTSVPYLKSAHLGQTETEAELLRRAEADLKRGERMEIIAIAGLALSATSLYLAYQFYSKRRVTPNRRRRPRRTR